MSEKGILSAFICSVRRFGVSLGRAGDSVCILYRLAKMMQCAKLVSHELD